jgi:MFS family permease
VGAVPAILLPHQVTLAFGEENQANVANLAIISTIGAFAAMVAQPIAGQISDRTRSRFGRRAPWIVLGALAGALSLVGLAFASSLVGFIIAWTLVQVCYNFAQGPLSAIMPDRVPQARRGTFAAITGIGLMVGAIGGQIVGSLFFNSITVGYITFAVLSVVILTLFVVANPDRPSTRLAPEPFSLGEFLRTFWVNPIAHPDFFWAFSGRLLLYTGYFAVTGYQLYLLQYYFHVDHPETVIPMLGLLSLVGIVISTAVSGPALGPRRAPQALRLRLRRLRQPRVPSAVDVAGHHGMDDHDVHRRLRLRHVPGRRHGAHQRGAAVGQVVREGPRRRQHRGDAAADPRPAVAGAIVLAFGYAGLFPVAIVLGILGALAIWPIKSVR